MLRMRKQNLAAHLRPKAARPAKDLGSRIIRALSISSEAQDLRGASLTSPRSVINNYRGKKKSNSYFWSPLDTQAGCHRPQNNPAEEMLLCPFSR